MLADVASNTGATSAARPDTSAGDMARLLLVVGGTFLFMYFMVIRPQSKRAKEQAALVKALKAGDKVITTSGIIGVVIAVKEKSLTLRSGDMKMEVLKSAVAEVDKSESSAS